MVMWTHRLGVMVVATFMMIFVIAVVCGIAFGDLWIKVVEDSGNDLWQEVAQDGHRSVSEAHEDYMKCDIERRIYRESLMKCIGDKGDESSDERR